MSHVLDSAAPATASLVNHDGLGPLGEFDPRLRVLAAAGFALIVVALEGFVALGVALLLACATMAAARIATARTLRRMAAMDGFIVFMLAMLPFTVPGDTLFTVFGFDASSQGLAQAIQIALKANAVVLMLMVLVGTMESTTLGHALHRLRAPATLVHLLMFSVRYIDVLYQEYRRLRTAMKARGFRPSNSRHTYTTFGYLIGMMLVRSLERSERIMAAMKCRGFSGRIYLLDHMRFARRDAAFATVFVAAAALLISLDRVHVAAD